MISDVQSARSSITHVDRGNGTKKKEKVGIRERSSRGKGETAEELIIPFISGSSAS